MGILNLEVNSLPESDVVPAAQYHLRIEDVEGPEVDKNDEEYLKFTYVITEGEYVNRKVFDNYVPVRGKSTLRKIINATSYTKELLATTEELIGEELDAIVGIEKSEKYGDQNKIRTYIVPSKKAGKVGKK